MTRFLKPTTPFWLSPSDENEIDFYLKDAIRHNGHHLENLTSSITEKYTTFLNQSKILHVWNVITYSTIPLPLVTFDYLAIHTRIPNRRSSVTEAYKEDYNYVLKYPYSPIIVDVLGRYHPIEVCAVRVQV
ncbi:hypothetical protein CRE_16333 [Caenorhabditis remanei]|uniref:Uncharacterized protein n=1 Tax=Caenorhabditis remanei TaxID=31234 RepID=E3N820_CAERE|nr:hypothetical protein CRE_16333 [Caenorhabditis remanei]